MENKNELNVIVKMKELCELVLDATEKSPKKFRFSIVSKMQNYVFNALENLYKANAIMAKDGKKKSIEKRINYQYMAITDIKLLTFTVQLAFELQCILKKEYIAISNKIYECQKLIGAWIKSEHKKIQNNCT